VVRPSVPVKVAIADANRAVPGEKVMDRKAATTGPTMKTTSSAVAFRLRARVRCDPASVNAVQMVRIDAPSGGARRPAALRLVIAGLSALSHESHHRTMPRHRLAILVLEGVLPMDFAIPSQVFLERQETPYSTVLCEQEPRVRVHGGFWLEVPGTLADACRADTVIVPGYADHEDVDVHPARKVRARSVTAMRVILGRPTLCRSRRR